MNAEPGPEYGGPASPARPHVKAEQGSGRRQRNEGYDVAGILMGAPILLIGLSLVAANGAKLATVSGGTLNAQGVLYFAWGLALLVVSAGLFIPGTVYRPGAIRGAGLAAAVLATAVAVPFAILAGACAWYLLSNPGDEFAILGVFFGAMALAAFGYAAGCTWALFKKLEIEPEQTAAVIAVGILAGALNVLVMYLVHCGPFFD